MLRLAKDAALVVCDRGYLRHQKRLRDAVADRAACRVIELESDVVVPVEQASNEPEFAARTIRPKIHKRLAEFSTPLSHNRVKVPSLGLKLPCDLDPSDWETALAKLKVDRSVAPSSRLYGGEDRAQKLLHDFLTNKLAGYAHDRREPGDGATSLLSAYLHFGQISPLDIALAVKHSAAPQADRDAYLEELIIRRELAINWVEYEPRYDQFDALPAWARKTLACTPAIGAQSSTASKSLNKAEPGTTTGTPPSAK